MEAIKKVPLVKPRGWFLRKSNHQTLLCLVKSVEDALKIARFYFKHFLRNSAHHVLGHPLITSVPDKMRELLDVVCVTLHLAVDSGRLLCIASFSGLIELVGYECYKLLLGNLAELVRNSHLIERPFAVHEHLFQDPAPTPDKKAGNAGTHLDIVPEN